MRVELEAFKTKVSKLTTRLHRHLNEGYKIDLLCGSISKTLASAIFCLAKFFVISFYRVLRWVCKKWSKKKLLHKASSTTFFWQLFFYSTENSIKISEKNMGNSTIFCRWFFVILAFFLWFMVKSAYFFSRCSKATPHRVSLLGLSGSSKPK